MKSLTLILSLLLITYSAQNTFALTACEVTNDETTKTTAVITCTADATLTGTTFKDDYLKLQNVTSKTATLATCTNACTGSGTFTCTITCTKVTGAEAGLLYTLTPIGTAATSNVFSSGANSGDGITLANADPTTKSYEGQAAASGNNNANTNTNNNNNNDTSDGNSLKYYLVSLLSLLLF